MSSRCVGILEQLAQLQPEPPRQPPEHVQVRRQFLALDILDPRVLPACTFIREGKLREASDYWNTVYTWRSDTLETGPSREDSPDRLAFDTMIVVETFRDQAEQFASQPGMHEAAKDATEYANLWNTAVAKALNLTKMQGSTDESGGRPLNPQTRRLPRV